MAKKILFISYYFPPYNSVGIKRVLYWFQNIHKYSYEAVVFTAIKQDQTNSNISFIPANDKHILSHFIKDEGINWLANLKSEMSKYKPDAFDSIIISGGPFMHMLLSKYLKDNFSSKIILDFRDPFYANPRFKSSAIKDQIKLFFQNKFLKYADIVITVNNECKRLIKHPNIHIIDNGYDENTLESIKTMLIDLPKESEDNITISAIGRVYSDFEMGSFFQSLKANTDFKFRYIGNNSFEKYENQYFHGGSISYSEALKFISKSDVCVIFTGGEAFESSTKIFDYLALNKTILIITNGEPMTGSMHQITHNYPNTFWAKNNSESISKALQEVEKHNIIKVNTQEFSREAGLKKLIQIIGQ